MIIFTNDTTKHLAKSFAQRPYRSGRYKKSAYADGATWLKSLVNLQRQKTAVVASVTPDPESFFDLIALHRMLKDNKANDRQIVIPYFAYARQDRLTKHGEIPLGLMMAEIIRNRNPEKIFTIDAHSQKILDMLGPDIEDLTALPLFAEKLKDQQIDALVAPDRGANKRVKRMAAMMDHPVGLIKIIKERPKADMVKATAIKGKVKNKNVAIIDDMISTGGTIVAAVKLLKQEGAKSITVCATHGIFSGGAREKLSKLKLESVMITNTIPQKRTKGFQVLDVAPVIKAALQS